MSPLRKSLSRIAKPVGRITWISIGLDAELGLMSAGNGLKAICILYGGRRKDGRGIFDVLKAYGAGTHARVVDLDGKPKTMQITGLLFSDHHHVKLVLSRLKEKYFPPRISSAGSPGTRVYVDPPYI
jgi:hypothetical protein